MKRKNISQKELIAMVKEHLAKIDEKRLAKILKKAKKWDFRKWQENLHNSK